MISSWFPSRTFPRRTHVVRRSKNSKSGISFFITRSCAGRPPRVCHTQSTPWYRIIRIAANSGKHQGTLALVPTSLINRGVRVLTANGDDLTDSSDPSRVMMRQIAGHFTSTRKPGWLRNSRSRATGRSYRSASAKAASPGPRSIRSWFWKRSDCGADLRRDISGHCATSPPSSPSLAI